VPDTQGAEFARGHSAGVIAAELREHGARLTRLNGSIERHAAAIEALTLSVQRLDSNTTANNRTVIAMMKSAEETAKKTAEALAAAELARRTKSEHSWSPLAQMGHRSRYCRRCNSGTG
jgi:methyl-accepting chemotaxis protein